MIYPRLPLSRFLSLSPLPLSSAKGPQPDPKFGSGNFVPPYTYTFKFTKPGTYNYVCCLHAALMRGVVIVKGELKRARKATAALAKMTRSVTASKFN